MNLILASRDIKPPDLNRMAGKALALASLTRATAPVRTVDRLTVGGFLGIVFVGTGELWRNSPQDGMVGVVEALKQ
jgi:hypothetical protein